MGREGATSGRAFQWAGAGLLLGLLWLAPSALAAQNPDCGCSGASVIPAGALSDERVGSVVVGSVWVVEGSPRKKGPGVHPRQEHPYPWLRYLVLAEKSWKKEARWLWVERPWGNCGSVLQPSRRYVFTLPKELDPQATSLGGVQAVTVAGCQAVQPLDDFGEALTLLGDPVREVDYRDLVRTELGQRLGDVTRSRRWCLPNETPQNDAAVALTPGQWTKFAAPAVGENVEWHVGQNGTAEDGLDDVMLAAKNPSACWLKVRPEVRSRWRVAGSARRVLRGGAGLTVEDGWIPPYWQGNVRLARDLPWIRSAKFHIERIATPRVGVRGSRGAVRSLDTPSFRVIALDPAPGALLDPGSKVRARLWWDGFPADAAEGTTWHFAMMLEGKDGSMLEPEGAAAPSGALTRDTQAVTIEATLDEALLDRSKEPLQLRFVVRQRAPGAEGAGEMVDALKPAVYGRGTEPPRESVPPPEKGPWYSGGAGHTCEEAIVVEGVASVQRGIAAERAWWRTEYPGSKMVKQSVSPPPPDGGGRGYDHIELQLADGSKKSLCFDITSFWGAPVRPGAPP